MSYVCSECQNLEFKGFILFCFYATRITYTSIELPFFNESSLVTVKQTIRKLWHFVFFIIIYLFSQARWNVVAYHPQHWWHECC